MYQKFAQAHVDGLKNLISSFDKLYAGMPDAQKKIANAEWDDNHREHHHNWNGGYYRAPPVVYGSRYHSSYYGSPYYYPPVIYGPGFGINLPGIR
jgi:hypothetical protein